MTVTLTDEGTGRLAYDIVGVASLVAAAHGSVANPFGCSVHIVAAHLLVKTQSALAGELSIGIGGAAEKKTDVWTTTAMNTQTEGSMYNCFADTLAAVTVLPTAVWTTALFLTFSNETASLEGFTGTLFLEVLRTPAA